MKFWRTLTSSLCILALAAIAALPAQAQRNQETETHAQSLSIPQEGLVQLSAEAPQRVRVGDQFEFIIQVTNASDNVILHNIKIAQQGTQQVNVESVEIQGQKQQQQKQQQAQQQQAQQKQKQQQQQQQQQKQQQASQQQGQRQQQKTWTIKQLNPGETRQIVVTASGETEGQQQMCLAVLSYTPSLCLTTEFVKPDVTLVKEAPERAGLCEVIEYEYYVKNEGSGDPGNFVIHDPLEDGLKTIEGDEEVRFEVDGLKPGETRKFVAALRAEEPGRYASRAIALLSKDDRVRSSRVGMHVQEADLDVAIDGPQTQYVNRVLNYTVRVTNNGEIAAPNATLDLHYPAAATILRMTDPQPSRNAVAADASEQQRASGSQDERRQNQRQQTRQRQNQQRQNEQAQQDPRRQRQSQQARNQQRQRQQREQRQDWEKATIELGTLEAGQTVALNFAARSDEQETLRFEAIASFVCAVGEDEERFVAREQVSTELIALPALAIAVTDNADPVPVGEELVYTVLVQNEGQASDSNIRVNAELPEGMEFVEASGPTDVKSQGQQLNFSPIEKLEPGETVTWKIRVRARQSGDVVLAAHLNSESLTKGAVAEEPTNLFEAGSQGAQKKKKRSQ